MARGVWAPGPNALWRRIEGNPRMSVPATFWADPRCKRTNSKLIAHVRRATEAARKRTGSTLPVYLVYSAEPTWAEFFENSFPPKPGDPVNMDMTAKPAAMIKVYDGAFERPLPVHQDYSAMASVGGVRRYVMEIYDDPMEGMIVHEMGHGDAFAKDYEWRSHIILTQEVKDFLKLNVSEYASSGVGEAYAEFYALSKSDQWDQVPADVRAWGEKFMSLVPGASRNAAIRKAAGR